MSKWYYQSLQGGTMIDLLERVMEMNRHTRLASDEETEYLPPSGFITPSIVLRQIETLLRRDWPMFQELPVTIECFLPSKIGCLEVTFRERSTGRHLKSMQEVL